MKKNQVFFLKNLPKFFTELCRCCSLRLFRLQGNGKNRTALGGGGGGVVDRLRQVKRNNPERFWWMEVYPVKFGERIRHKHYHDTTTYMMAVVKKLLSPYDEETGLRKPVELILPDDDDLVAQLSGRKYGLTEASKIKIESKDAVKKRGQPSPDEADCVLLLCLPVKPPKRKKEAKRHG